MASERIVSPRAARNDELRRSVFRDLSERPGARARARFEGGERAVKTSWSSARPCVGQGVETHPGPQPTAEGVEASSGLSLDAAAGRGDHTSAAWAQPLLPFTSPRLAWLLPSSPTQADERTP